MFPYFACLWLAKTASTRLYPRVSTPQTAFSGLFGRVNWPHIRAFYILANEMVRYCDELAMSLHLQSSSVELFMNVLIFV